MRKRNWPNRKNRPCPDCGRMLTYTRKDTFDRAVGNNSVCKSCAQLDRKLTVETIEKIFEQQVKEDEPLGNDPTSGESIWIKKGPYGYYVQIGETKTRKGIPKQFSLSDVNLDYALKLLSLPREVGIHPDNQEIVTADYGRYGPYIKCGKSNAPLRGVETPLDISLEKAVELLANRKKSSSELKSLGVHPESGNTLTVKTGRYGPYVSDGKIIYSQNKTRSAVSKKHLLSCLGDYFSKQGNPEAAAAMTKYILDSRETKVKDNIRFKQPK